MDSVTVAVPGEGTHTRSALLWSFLEQGGAKVVLLAVQIVLARLLAPEAFGTLAIMLVVVDVANVISQSGLGSALIQRSEITDADCDTALWISLGLASAIYALVFAGAPLMGFLYDMPDLPGYLRVLALGVPFNAVNSVQRSVLQRGMDFRSIFRANMAAAVVSGVVGVWLAVAGAGIWALVAQSIALAAAACLAMAFAVPWRPKIRMDLDVARELVSFGWAVCATGVLNVIYTGVSELILGRACTQADLGLYSQGRKWPNAGVGVATNAIQNVMFPAFAKLQDDSMALAEAIRNAVGTGTWAIAGFGMGMLACAEPLVELLLGEQWLGCVEVFRLTCAGTCLLMLQLANLRAYMAIGNSGLYLRLQVAKVALSCAVIWPVAALTQNISATAWVTFVMGVVSIVFVDLRPAKRTHGVGAAEQLRLITPAVAVACISAAAATSVGFFSLPVLVLLMTQVAVYGVCYLGLSLALQIPGAGEAIQLMRKVLVRS